MSNPESFHLLVRESETGLWQFADDRVLVVRDGENSPVWTGTARALRDGVPMTTSVVVCSICDPDGTVLVPLVPQYVEGGDTLSYSLDGQVSLETGDAFPHSRAVFRRSTR